MNRISKFHKVSFEQFKGDWTDTFGELPEGWSGWQPASARVRRVDAASTRAANLLFFISYFLLFLT